MPLNTIPNKGLTSRGYPSDRLVTPIIINGDMSVAQRGTSSTGQTGGGYKTCDRWQNVQIFGTFTVSQSTDVPTGQGFVNSFKMDCTTANASPSAGNTLHISQRIEGQNLQMLKKGTSSAEATTLSFWVKSNKTGTYQVNLRDKDNTRIIGKTYTINSADTWEKKILNFAGDTTGAFGNDNGNSLEVEWFLGAGSTYTGGAVPTAWEAESAGDRAAGLTVNLADNTANEWYFTGVQLEVGEFDSTTIPSFPFESYESNLQKCQRYFETFPSNGGDGVIGFGYGSGSDTARTMFPFKVTKRATPTMSDSLSSSRQYRINFMNGSGTATNQNSTSTPGFGTVSTLNSGYMNLAGFSSIGGGLFGFLIYNNSTTLLSADAEL